MTGRSGSRIVVTAREGAKFRRHRCASLDAALALTYEEAERIAAAHPGRTIGAMVRDFEPIEQVVGRVEVTLGGGLLRGAERGGIDVRGDGSMEAYAGRVRRTVVPLQPGEAVVDGLRRALTGAN